MAPAVPRTTLNDGTTIPQLGYGVFQVPPEEAEKAVGLALQAGYRNIDTAAAYQNEEGVGRALAASGLDRDEVYVTTKLWNRSQGRDKALRAFDKSMARLGLEVLDLYLIHWPVPSLDLYVETWTALEELQRDGRVRSIGVSNFTPAHLQRLFDETGVVPALNQVELHPYLPQEELRAFHAEHGIATEAWSPIGAGGDLLAEPVLAEIGGTYGKSPAQVVLRWHVQLGNVVIPKSVTPERIAANLDVFDFALTDEQMASVSGLASGQRLGPDPDTFAAV